MVCKLKNAICITASDQERSFGLSRSLGNQHGVLMCEDRLAFRLRGVTFFPFRFKLGANWKGLTRRTSCAWLPKPHLCHVGSPGPPLGAKSEPWSWARAFYNYVVDVKKSGYSLANSSRIWVYHLKLLKSFWFEGGEIVVHLCSFFVC